jgi:hypothetical protein
MLGLPVRYFFKRPFTTVRSIAADPVQLWMTVQDEYAAKREAGQPKYSYAADAGWERQLHAGIGAPWPCSATTEFRSVWSQANAQLKARGIEPGPESFQWWNDGDAGFARAIWCLVRHLRPKKVVETGVAHGVTSSCILEALERNGEGHLWSIDLPPLDQFWREQVGAAVDDRHRSRWTYIPGSSRRRLPKLLSELGQIDLFVHDSLHSERNVCFELQQAREYMAATGAFVVDDIDANRGFRTFSLAHPAEQCLIGESEPLRPDLRRPNQKGLFGVILKNAAA